ncbi:MAG: DUF2207 domain-containing protein [Coprobacillus sp.]
MKKKICIIFSLFIISLLSLTPISAASTQINDMRITAYINDDGSAHIQEVWDMDVNKGTEVYKVFNNMGSSRLSNLKVKDNTGRQYQNIGEWDVDASKSEKNGKCGLVTKSGGYELCFGIGNYGSKTYTFEYDVSNFVKQYKNDQGLNYAFFTDLALDTRQATITLSSSQAFNKENSSIYAFGYHGDVNFMDGKVVMKTNQNVDSEQKMQLLMRMDNGMFKKAQATNQDFDDILADAKEGSDYSEDGIPLIIFGFIVVTIIGMAFFIFCIASFSKKISNNGKFIFNDHIPLKPKKEIIMFRDIPCDKDIFKFYYLAKKFKLIYNNDRGGMIAAILLKWIQKGYIQFEKREEKSLGIFKKDGFSIDFNKDIPCVYPFEEELLNYFKEASGGNVQLETKEFELWCKTNYEKIDDWFNHVEGYMIRDLQNKGLLTIEKRYSKVMGFKISSDIDCYDASIREEMEHIYGLKAFLEEMSLINEKEVIEVKMWEEYLIYASILGIADRVQEQLGELCPTFNQQSELDTIYTMHMVHMFAYNSMRASNNASQAARSDGFGGGASFGGGGGGFSGGGGGGVR